MSRRSRAVAGGFSLLELMVAIFITALAIAAGAKIAGSAIRSSRRGTETTDLGQRARILARQLRTDLRLAGQGSTGAVGVANVQPWSTMSAGYLSAQGSRAIPAVSGANNIAGGTIVLGRTTPAWVTDAIQLVVPDPSTLQRTESASARLAAQIRVPDAMTCPAGMAYISDHGSSNGGGRTQIVQITNALGAGPVNLAAGETLQFEIPAGADVMCARVSTYWIGIPPGSPVPWLHRTDIVAGAAPTQLAGAAGTAVYLGNVAAGMDLAAPAVYDLQIAYAFSSEEPSLVAAGLGRAANPTQRWAFAPGGAATPGGRGWFEAREVRFNLLISNLRNLAETSAGIAEMATEDGAPVTLPTERARFRLTASEALTSLRYFDKVVPQNVPAEPY